MKTILKTGAVASLLLGIALVLSDFGKGYISLNPQERKVDALFRYLERGNSPGVAVLVIRDGKVVLRKAFGNANLEHRIPLTPGSVMDMGSMSKQFTAFALATLIADGRLSLDDPVRTYIPELPEWGDRVRLSHLAFHTSGIRDWAGTLALGGLTLEDVLDQDDILQMAIHQQELVSEPGERYDYCNTGWNLLGIVIERVTGQSLRSWLDQNLFGPLQMDRTFLRDDPGEVIPDRAEGYRGPTRDGFLRVTDNMAGVGSSSIRSSLDDLARWYLNFESHEVGGEGVFEALMSKSLMADGTIHYKRLALDEGSYRGLHAITHAGIWAGFRHQFMLFPEERMTFVVLSNADFVRSACKVREVADIYLESRLGEATRTRPSLDSDSPTAVPSEILDEYQGFFRLGQGRYVLVTREGDSLLATQTGKDPVILVPISETEFWAERDYTVFTFRRNEDGEVHRLEARNDRDYRCTAAENFQFSIERPEGWSSPPTAPNRAEMPSPLSLSEMMEYQGTYVSDEVASFYRVFLTGDTLALRHRRHGVLPLTFANRDEFQGAEWFNRAVLFQRDEEGAVEGMVIDLGARARNLYFRRADSPPGMHPNRGD